MNCHNFQQMMRKARPGQHIRYHLGNLAEASLAFKEVEKKARFVRAMCEIGIALMYQKREPDGLMGYYVILTGRLKVRKDGQGSLQEAQRVMEIV